jgi:hypothetical protein
MFYPNKMNLCRATYLLSLTLRWFWSYAADYDLYLNVCSQIQRVVRSLFLNEVFWPKV